MKEIWKEINGYGGVYLVSNLGRVKSLWHKKIQKERIMKPHIDNGYMRVCLRKEGRPSSERVHRLVAMAFVENPDGKPEVNHIDGNKINNNATNLEWVTHTENIRHAFTHGLVPRPKGSDHYKTRTILQFDLDGNFIKRWNGTGEIKRELGLWHSGVCACIKNKLSKSGGYVWKLEQ